MRKILTILLLVCCTNGIAKGKPEVVYVGNGRYVCQGDKNSLPCAQVDANNRQQEERRSYDYERKREEEARHSQELESSHHR